MTPEQLQAIRERCEKATPGPWEWDERAERIYSPQYWVVKVDEGVTDEDAEFIAHARTDIPALLDEIERCHEVINKLKQDIYQHEFWAEKSVKERERLLGALKTIITIDDRCDSDFEASEDLRKVAEIARQALEGSQ